ncbi:MAG TPA: hypothetical protein VGC99_05410 [Candidatus Tectomicrobia bacterium]
MKKIAAHRLALSICLLAFVFASSNVHDDTPGPNWSQPGHKLDSLSLAVIVEAEATPTPATTSATQTPSLLPTVTATALAIAVAAAPAMAPAPTPGIEITLALSTEAIAAVQSIALPVTGNNSSPEAGSAAACSVATPPDSLRLDPFYTKYCSAVGVPILASTAVPDQALQRAWEIITHMLAGISQAEKIKGSITALGTRIGIIGVGQATTDMPEHRNLYTQFPGIDWNNRARGVGATPQIPLLSIAEENLLCYTNDRWIGQNILVHEFAHTIKNMGLDVVDPGFDLELQGIYQHALDAGLWTGTYVASNIDEYWAEGVRLYFQIDPVVDMPGSLPYPANTRAELQTYDPDLYGIVEHIFGHRDGIPLCP